MNQSYYMSIGYPIGLCKSIENEENYYNIEINGDFKRLSFLSYNIYNICFFDIKTKETISEILEKKLKINNFSLDLELNKLINEKVLIKLETNKIENIYEKIKNFTLLRNGFGIGINDKNNAIILNQKQNFEISLIEYNIWAESDNRKTIDEIKEKLKLQENLNELTCKHYLINIIFKLKMLDLLRLNLKECKYIENK